jgi:phosphoesterase RecJ-like protein
MDNNQNTFSSHSLTANSLAAQTLLQTKQRVFLTTHERTDGDDLGTVLALAQALQRQGKTVRIGIRGGVPRSLAFLPGSELVTETGPSADTEIIIVSGCSNLARTGLAIEPIRIPIINFDHHPDNTRFGTINLVDPNMSSVAELAYNFCKILNWPIENNMAICLLTGMMSDTGSFLHSNTQPSTLYAASNLMNKGARTTTIANHTFKGKAVPTLKAWSKALANTWYDPEKSMVCSIITDQDLQELNHPPQNAFEGVVETINKVPEARFALFLKQDGPLIKGSLRSDPHKPLGGLDVGTLARLLGGGGHRNAAGFAFPGRLEKKDNTWFITPIATNAT